MKKLETLFNVRSKRKSIISLTFMIILLTVGTITLAHAAPTTNYVTQWNGAGLGHSSLGAPYGVAVNSATGNVYVAEFGDSLIFQFDSSGGFIRQWGSWTGGAAPSAFANPVGVAVDGSGNVYVVDSGHNRIVEFTSVGAYIREFGNSIITPLLSNPQYIAVNLATGDVFVADAGNNRIVEFDASGTYIREFGNSIITPLLSNPTGIAVNPTTGDVFVADTGNSLIQVFDANGNYIRQWGDLGTPSGIAVDGSGNVFVTENTASIINVTDTSGTLLMQFGNSFNSPNPDSLYGPQGIAVDAATGNVYVADNYNARIVEFKVTGLPLFVVPETAWGTTIIAIFGAAAIFAVVKRSRSKIHTTPKILA